MQTLAEKEKQYSWPVVSDAKAQASFLPAHTGDGYAFGGGALVVIGEFAIQVGEGVRERALAEEIARRWNAAQ